MNELFLLDVLRYLVFSTGGPWILPPGDEVLSTPFSTIRKMEGGATDVLYASMTQGSYFCTQTAASKPAFFPVPTSEYTGKLPFGTKGVASRMRTISVVVQP